MSKRAHSTSGLRPSVRSRAALFIKSLLMARPLAIGVSVALFATMMPAQAQTITLSGDVTAPVNTPLVVPDPLPVPWDLTEHLYVSYPGDGTLEIADGAQMTFSQNHIAIIGASGEGTVTVTGNNSSWSPNTLDLQNGALYIENNAEVTHVGDAEVVGGSSVTVTSGATWTFGLTSTLILDPGILNIGALGSNDSAGTVDVNLITSVGPGLGTINFNQSDHIDFDVLIEGTINLYQRGAGSTTLTANNTYTGITTVTDGTLLVNGSITSTSHVWDGARLGGTGDLGYVNIRDGGIHAPGNSIDTQAVVGDWFLQDGGIYEVELTDAGNTAGVHNDLITVSGVATLADGAIIHVTPENGVDDGTTYTPGTTYSILRTPVPLDPGTVTLDVQGSIVVTDDFPNLDFTVSFSDNSLRLTSHAAESEIGTVSLPMLSWPMLWLTAIGLLVLARSRFARETLNNSR